MAHENPYDQPLFEGFDPTEEAVDPAKRSQTAARIAEVAEGYSPYVQRESEAFAGLGGGTSQVDSEELPRTGTKPIRSTADSKELWKDSFGLSASSKEFPDGAPRATEAQRLAASRAVAHLKTLTPPTKD